MDAGLIPPDDEKIPLGEQPPQEGLLAPKVQLSSYDQIKLLAVQVMLLPSRQAYVGSPSIPLVLYLVVFGMSPYSTTSLAPKKSSGLYKLILRSINLITSLPFIPQSTNLYGQYLSGPKQYKLPPTFTDSQIIVNSSYEVIPMHLQF